MARPIERFLGGSISGTIIKLLVISFLVGLVMAAFNWSPIDIFDNIIGFFVRIWQQGFAALGRFGEYLMLGAAVVIPIFLIIRIFSFRR